MKKTVKLAKSLLSVANELDSMGLTKEADVLDKVASSLVKRAADIWVPQEAPGFKNPNVYAASHFIKSILKARVPYQLKAFVDSLKGRAGYGVALQNISDQVNELQARGQFMEWKDVETKAKRAVTSLKIIMRELEKEGVDEYSSPEYDVAKTLHDALDFALSAAQREYEAATAWARTDKVQYIPDRQPVRLDPPGDMGMGKILNMPEEDNESGTSDIEAAKSTAKKL